MKITAKVVIGGGVVGSGIPGLVEPIYAEAGSSLKIEILGEMYKASVIKESPFDPDNACLRS
jgi:glycine cleavage system aminomethyltransferase T